MLPRMLRWLRSMPESMIAMPTPRPSSMPDPAAACSSTPAPLPACSRLAWRAALRLGEMLCTSARAANAVRLVAGTIADTARSDR